MRKLAKGEAARPHFVVVGTDDWKNPYTGNGFTLSTDPVVPESTLTEGATIADGSEIWAVRSDGTQELKHVYDGVDGKWVAVS